MTRALTGSLAKPLALACWLLLSGCEPPVAAEVADQRVRPARLFQVAPLQQAQRYEFVSRVSAAQTVDLAFEVSGPLAQLPVRAGQRVPAGQLVAALDARDFALAVEEAQVNLRLARADLERKTALLGKRAISQAAVDDANAQADLTQVRLAQAREALADSQLRAPFDAYVARRYVDKHTNVSAGKPIVRLLDLRELHLIANVPEALLATVAADKVTAISARFAFAPDQAFPLRYQENTGEADAVAQTYEVTFAMPSQPDWNILPGMTATVTVSLQPSTSARLQVPIPTQALVSGAAGEFHVWVFDAATRNVEKRSVRIGPASGSGVMVIDGLQGDELIVTTGASQLQAGMQIDPLGEPDSEG